MKKNRLFLLTILILILFANNLFLSNAATKFKIEGFITQKDLSVISNAKIEIYDDQELLGSTNSDIEGKYRIFLDLIKGHEYIIEASKEGYQTYTDTFTVPDRPGSSPIIIDIILYVSPVADANGPYTGDVDESISFSSSGSSDPDGTITEYLWDFDDGQSSTNANPSHTYSSEGTYHVTLTVTDDDGLTDTDQTTCTISAGSSDSSGSSSGGFAIGNLSPIVDTGGPYEGEAGDSIMFIGTGSYDPDGVLIKYNWDFGDGKSDFGEIVEHVYQESGNYEIKLTVEDEEGKSKTGYTSCYVIEKNLLPIPIINGPYTGKVGSLITFNSEGSYDPDGIIIDYIWDFNDGKISNEKSPTHVYSKEGEYSITLTITDDKGAQTFTSTLGMIEENIPPIASINGPYEGEVNEALKFSSRGSIDLDGNIIEYRWDFGDGKHSFQENPNHVYNSPKEYILTLSVTDDEGSIDTIQTKCIVYYNEVPVVIHNGPYIGAPNEEITFSSEGTHDPDGNILMLAWDFGDGTIVEENNPTHYYSETGLFTIKLTATDDSGKTSTEVTSVLVIEKTKTTTFPIYTIGVLSLLILLLFINRNQIIFQI
jgi:PKD repeat protein